MKPIFTPSSLGDFDTCKLKYWYRWEKLLAFPSGVAVQPTLGTFGHELQGAHERGDHPGKTLEAAIKKVKLSTAYTATDHPVVSQLKTESLMIFRGGVVRNSQGKVSSWPGYPEYRKSLKIHDQKLRTLAVEETLIADLGPVIIAPTLDLILETESDGDLWVAEHKYTERDDKGWEIRWLLDGQTTLQVLATEEVYQREVKGVLLLPVLYGRKKAKEGEKGILTRPIIRVNRPEPRWIPKNSSSLRSGMMDRLEDLAIEYPERLASNRWPQTGVLTRDCDLCAYRGICSGKDSPKRLQPMMATAHEWKLAKLRKKQ